MSFYKCGHNRHPVFMKKDILSYASYLEWRESTGFEGDKSECYNCFCKRLNKKEG